MNRFMNAITTPEARLSGRKHLDSLPTDFSMSLLFQIFKELALSQQRRRQKIEENHSLAYGVAN